VTRDALSAERGERKTLAGDSADLCVGRRGKGDIVSSEGRRGEAGCWGGRRPRLKGKKKISGCAHLRGKGGGLPQEWSYEFLDPKGVKTDPSGKNSSPWPKLKVWGEHLLVFKQKKKRSDGHLKCVSI